MKEYRNYSIIVKHSNVLYINSIIYPIACGVDSLQSTPLTAACGEVAAR